MIYLLVGLCHITSIWMLRKVEIFKILICKYIISFYSRILLWEKISFHRKILNKIFAENVESKNARSLFDSYISEIGVISKEILE